MSNNVNNKKELSADEIHYHRVLGGYKATLSNHSSSEEARQRAEDMLEYFRRYGGEGEKATEVEKLTEDEKHMHHVLGGYKATLSNEKSSEEAKKKAQEMLDQYTGTAKRHQSHVMGGYKATLVNSKSSEEAKNHAKEMLKKAGVDPEERANESNLSEEDKHFHHVLGGYKATLSNEKASEEAKAHAQDMLDRLSRGEELEESEYNRFSKNEATDSHVIGGYRATLSNEKSSEEAKAHAREMLEKAGLDPEAETSKFSNNEATDSHVIGGYKATLSNEKASEEAKAHAREMLEKAGIDLDEKSEDSEKRGLKRSNEEVSSEEKGKQGFASMPKEKVQEIASLGGRTQHAGEEPLAKKAAK